MARLNKVELIGRLVGDPEVVDLSNDAKVANFSVAVQDRIKRKDGYEDIVDYFDCKTFGKQCNILEQYGTKGKQLFIEGRLKQDKWQDKETQKQRSRVYVLVSNFQFLGSPNKGDSESKPDTESKPTPSRGRPKKQEPPKEDIPF